MKKVLLLTCTILLAFSAQSQCDFSYDYANQTGWTLVDLTNNGTFTGTARVNISNGTFNFNNAPDGNNDIRGFTDLGTSLCESWIAEFDLIITGTGTTRNRVIGHIPLSLTANNLSPFFNVNGAATDNDAIGVQIADGQGAGTSDMNIRPYYKDGTAFTVLTDCSELIALNVNYHVTLERINNTNGRITVENTDNSTIILECCFTIPETVENLRFLQHSNNPQGFAPRVMTGSIDNTCIRNCERLDDCCLDEEIAGPTAFCVGDEGAPVFSVTNSASATYTWSVSGGATFTGQGTNQIAITNMSTLTGPITVQVDIECGCNTITLTKTVEIYPDLSTQPGFAHSANNNGSTVGLSATSQATAAGITHTWNIYFAASCADPTDRTILNENTLPVALGTPGFGTTYALNGLDPSRCYIIQHIISYENGLCPAEFRAKILSTQPDSESSGTGVYYPGGGTQSKVGALSSDDRYTKQTPLNVYPNPANNLINVVMESSDESFKVLLYNMEGKLLQEKPDQKNHCKLNTSGLSRGTYLLKIETNAGKVYNRTVSIID